MRILVLLLLWPILEIAVFMAVGDEIGFLNAFLLWGAGAVLGGFLIQQQGLRTAFSLQNAVNQGEMPMTTLFSGICVFLAGVLLILPGFLSDIVAILLLIPQIRPFLRNIAARRLGGDIGQGRYSSTHSPPSQGDIIDADYVEIKSEETDEEPHKLEHH